MTAPGKSSKYMITNFGKLNLVITINIRAWTEFLYSPNCLKILTSSHKSGQKWPKDDIASFLNTQNMRHKHKE